MIPAPIIRIFRIILLPTAALPASGLRSAFALSACIEQAPVRKACCKTYYYNAHNYIVIIFIMYKL